MPTAKQKKNIKKKRHGSREIMAQNHIRIKYIYVCMYVCACVPAMLHINICILKKKNFAETSLNILKYSNFFQ